MAKNFIFPIYDSKIDELSKTLKEVEEALQEYRKKKRDAYCKIKDVESMLSCNNECFEDFSAMCKSVKENYFQIEKEKNHEIERLEKRAAKKHDDMLNFKEMEREAYRNGDEPLAKDFSLKSEKNRKSYEKISNSIENLEREIAEAKKKRDELLYFYGPSHEDDKYLKVILYRAIEQYEYLDDKCCFLIRKCKNLRNEISKLEAIPTDEELMRCTDSIRHIDYIEERYSNPARCTNQKKKKYH